MSKYWLLPNEVLTSAAKSERWSGAERKFTTHPLPFHMTKKGNVRGVRDTYIVAENGEVLTVNTGSQIPVEWVEKICTTRIVT